MRFRLEAIVSRHVNSFAAVRVRGHGGAICLKNGRGRKRTAQKAFEKGSIERCGRLDQIVKCLPALTIDLETLDHGLEIFKKFLVEALSKLRSYDLTAL